MFEKEVTKLEVDELIEKVVARIVKFFPWESCDFTDGNAVEAIVRSNIRSELYEFFGMSAPIKMRSPRAPRKE